VSQRARVWVQFAAFSCDFVAVAGGTWLAFLFRFSEPIAARIPIVTGLPPVDWYIWLSLAFGVLTPMMLLVGGMYSFPRQDSLLDELASVFKYFISAYTLLLAALFFYRGASFSRLTMVLIFLFSGGCLMLVRIAARWLRQKLYLIGVAVRRAAIVGEGEQALPVIHHLERHPEFGLKVVGSISYGKVAPQGLERLGSVNKAGETVREHRLDTLIIAPAAEDREVLPELVAACYGVNIDFLYLPELHPANGRPKRIFEVGGVPLWTLKENPFQGWMGIVKRIFDVVVSVLLIILTLPLMAVISLAIKLNSRGPLLFRQRRVGLDGGEFNCLKFRSMAVDAEAKTGPVWAKPGDTRVTAVGRILRRWSLDELPQLFNVLRGDMSLVGPRPERPEFVRQFEEKIDGYQERHRVRSGLTGWAQVNGLRGDTPIEARTEYDRYYVENWSLWFDLKILFLTVRAVIKGENSY